MILRRKLKMPFLKIKWKISDLRRRTRIAKRQFKQIEKLYELQKETKKQFLEIEKKSEKDYQELKIELKAKLKILDWVLGYIDG